MKCGLLGRKLSHSYSPAIHAHLGSYSYQLFEKEPEDVGGFLKNGDFTGLNVTIPYKKDIIPFLDSLSPQAEILGAVNTIVRRPDGTLIGHNTDYFGFLTMVRQSGLQVDGKKVLVLGSGGASNTCCKVLQELGAKVIVVSRSGENNYSNLQLHRDAAVIINATPVGMYPKVEESPIDLERFPALEGVLDLIYNPARTQLLLQAEKRGLVAVNGLLMLVAQAKESAEWFTGKAIGDEKIAQIHGILRCQMENIVLIGMPGCGKSTVAKLLEEKLGRQAVDADAVIAETAGCSIPEIFSQGGEDAFRKIETEVLRQLGAKSAQIIATGGGCVTRQENFSLLHRNGVIFWLQRDIDSLPTDGRPLSKSGKLADMYRVRGPLYESFADHIIDNNGTPEDACKQIMDILGGTV